VQPRFVLKEVQVPPGFADPVVYALVSMAAVWTTQTLGVALDIEVDAVLGCIEFDVLDLPGRLQTKGCGEQGFCTQDHAICCGH
jgi:hypothetical protein